MTTTCLERQVNIDMDNIILNNNDCFIPFQILEQNSNNIFYLFLSEKNLPIFKNILQNKKIDHSDAKHFISNSNSKLEVPNKTDSDLHSLLSIVVQDSHLMKNIIFAFNMRSSAYSLTQ